MTKTKLSLEGLTFQATKINEAKNSLNELIPNSCNEKIENIDKELINFF